MKNRFDAQKGRMISVSGIDGQLNFEKIASKLVEYLFFQALPLAQKLVLNLSNSSKTFLLVEKVEIICQT